MTIDYNRIKAGNNYLYLAEKPCYRIKDKMDCSYFIDDYLEFLNEKDIKTIVVLLTNNQIQQSYGFDLIESYKLEGYNVIHYPIRDFSTPKDIPSFERLMKRISSEIRSGNVLIHCSAGLGRTGLVASGFVIYNGYKPKDAIELVRRVRIGSVETREQAQWLENYALYKKSKQLKRK